MDFLPLQTLACQPSEPLALPLVRRAWQLQLRVPQGSAQKSMC
jgi:hypothetical protein